MPPRAISPAARNRRSSGPASRPTGRRASRSAFPRVRNAASPATRLTEGRSTASAGWRHPGRSPRSPRRRSGMRGRSLPRRRRAASGRTRGTGSSRSWLSPHSRRAIGPTRRHRTGRSPIFADGTARSRSSRASITGSALPRGFSPEPSQLFAVARRSRSIEGLRDRANSDTSR